MNAHATVAPRRFLLPVLATLLVAACTSIPSGNDWKGQRRYGTFMARRGFWHEALFRYEKAAALKPDDGETQNNLAVAYESIGDTSKALDAYKKALALDPANPQIKRNYARFAEYYTSVQRAAGGPVPALAAPGAPPARTGAAPPATPPVGAPPTATPTPSPTPAVEPAAPTPAPAGPEPTPAAPEPRVSGTPVPATPPAGAVK